MSDTGEREVVEYRPPTRRARREGAAGAGPVWDGRRTRFTVGWGRYLNHDHEFLGEGDAVEYQASEVDGRWTGPDAKQVARLIRSGTFAGTEEHDAFRRAREAMEAEWGVNGGGPDGQPLRPDLATPSKDEFLDHLSSADPRFAARLKDPALTRQHEEWERGDMLSQLRAGLGGLIGQPVQDGGTVSLADLSDEDLEAVLAARRKRKDSK